MQTKYHNTIKHVIQFVCTDIFFLLKYENHTKLILKVGSQYDSAFTVHGYWGEKKWNYFSPKLFSKYHCSVAWPLNRSSQNQWGSSADQDVKFGNSRWKEKKSMNIFMRNYTKHRTNGLSTLCSRKICS